MLAADIRANNETEAVLRPSSPEDDEMHEEDTMEKLDELPEHVVMCRPVSEAGMFAQPTSAASKQDVGHVLVRLFKERLSRPVLGGATIENLLRSEEGTEDVYHKHYVDSLRRVTSISFLYYTEKHSNNVYFFLSFFICSFKKHTMAQALIKQVHRYRN